MALLKAALFGEDIERRIRSIELDQFQQQREGMALHKTPRRELLATAIAAQPHI